jgi:hypothetical protein
MLSLRTPAEDEPRSRLAAAHRDEFGIDLYWLPLGAGGRWVRRNGQVYEAVSALRQRRPAAPLYHCALMVTARSVEHVIEMTPAWTGPGGDRGVVAEGAVGTRWAGWLRLFRYEVRCWPGGTIGDVAEAVGGPRRLTHDPVLCRRLLTLLPSVPTPVWGRDELRAGEMWNSNSVISWALASSGLGMRTIHPPDGGRAPGWAAGLVVAGRQLHPSTSAAG